MLDEWKEGLICLIAKGDEVVEDTKGWRLIPLLNTIYKIFVKVLALCLPPLLLDIIHTFRHVSWKKKGAYLIILSCFGNC